MATMILAAICISLTALVNASRVNQNITIGYLMSDYSKQYVPLKQGRIASGAMTYAVRQINDDPNLLPNINLQFMVADTQASTLVGTAKVIEQFREGAIAFFGPEDSCDTEARVAAALNLPMISHVSCMTALPFPPSQPPHSPRFTSHLCASEQWKTEHNIKSLKLFSSP